MKTKGAWGKAVVLDEGMIDLYEMTGRCAMTMREVARWAARPRARRTIREVERLAGTRAGLLMANARGEAAKRLMELVAQDGDKELARRAAVDVIRLEREERAMGEKAQTEGMRARGERGEIAKTAEDEDRRDRVRAVLAKLSGMVRGEEGEGERKKLTAECAEGR